MMAPRAVDRVDTSRPSLDVALREVPSGGLGESGADVWFKYDAHVVARDDGDPLSPRALSVRLPVVDRAYGHTDTLVFFDNLLLESDTRAELARLDQRDASDVAGLLGRVGAECAGAVSIRRAGEEIPPPAYRPLERAEVERLFDERHGERLTQAVLESQQVMSGVQRKLVLRRDGDAWSLPLHGAPGTHLVKRSSGRYDGLVANELACLRLFATLGLPVNDAFAFDGAVAWPDGTVESRLLAVQRFDRVVVPDTTAVLTANDRLIDSTRIERLHQEDLCQITGRRPTAKYQANGGPTFRDLATAIRRWSVAPDADLPRALSAAIANVCLGNGDAHGKNFAMVITTEGHRRLAPFYDIVSTDVYPALTPTFAMRFGHADRAAQLGPGDLDRFARDLGMGASLVRTATDAVTTGLRAALDDVLHAVAGEMGVASPVLDRLRALVLERANRLEALLVRS